MYRMAKRLKPWIFIMALFSSSLTSASSVASCTLNGNFKHTPGAPGQYCWTEICCNSGNNSPGNYWMSGLPSMAASACSAPKVRHQGEAAVGGQTSAACDANTLNWANQMTPTDMVKRSAQAGGYPVDGAQCRFDKSCDGEG
jgi:hypothetical protein